MSSTTTTVPQHVELARQFAAELIQTLTAEQMQTVRERNRTPRYEMACATHDFCDANEVMVSAFQKVTGMEANFDDDDFAWDLITAAWRLAKQHEFVPAAIPNDAPVLRDS